MTEKAVRKLRKELNSGTVALVLLALLDSTDRPAYGYEIAKRLSEAGELPVKQGALYPALRSLESQGLLASSVEPSVSGPPRKYYRITNEGRQVLALWRQEWGKTRHFVDSWLEEA